MLYGLPYYNYFYDIFLHLIFLYQVQFECEFDFGVSGIISKINIQYVTDFLKPVFYRVVV